LNAIYFPAGVLQPPNFDMAADDAANYGNLASLIGHELTHGFDDEGRHYDAQGNLKDLWTKEDAASFDARAAGLVREYNVFVAVQGRGGRSKDVHVNGELTLGENTADNGGAGFLMKRSGLRRARMRGPMLTALLRRSASS